MIVQKKIRRVLGAGVLLALAGTAAPPAAWGQPARPPQTVVTVEQPDAERTKEELTNLLNRYPPGVRGALALDPSLFENQSYLATYPALAGFLNTHPEIARNPSFFVEPSRPFRAPDHQTQVLNMWQDVFQALAVFAGFGLAIGVVTWLIRTLVDYRRWSRLAKVQTDAHTKLLDRFTSNEDLLAYIKSPAGAKFLESSPIKLDAGPRSVGAPLTRILWSVQGGLVLIAGGIGLRMVSGQVAADASQPLQVLGVLGIAIGVGLLVSAGIAWVISQRMGLIEPGPARRDEPAGAEPFTNLK